MPRIFVCTLEHVDVNKKYIKNSARKTQGAFRAGHYIQGGEARAESDETASLYPGSNNAEFSHAELKR